MQVAVPQRIGRAPRKAAGSLGLVIAIAIALAACLILAMVVKEEIAYLAVLAIAAPIGLFYMSSRPAVAVAIALASHAWSVELSSQYVTPFKIAGVVAILVVARDHFARRVSQPIPRAYSYGVVCLLTLVALGEFAAEYESSTSPFFEFGGTLVIFALLTQTFLTTEQLRMLCRVHAINLLLTFASVWREVGWSALGDSGTRAGGICGQPNLLGNHLAMSLPFALALLADSRERRTWRVIGFLALLGSAYGEWGAASRGGTLGFVVGIFAFAFLAPRRNTIRVGAIVLALVAAGAFTSLAPKSFGRVTDTFDGTQDLESATSERALHARISGEMFPKHPFLGAGVTAFGYERSRYSGSLGGALHSSVLAVAVAYGLPALLLYIILQASGVYVVVRRLGDGRDRVLMAALAAAALAAITSGLSGTELFRAEQWGIVSLCHIFAFRHDLAERGAARPSSA